MFESSVLWCPGSSCYRVSYKLVCNGAVCATVRGVVTEAVISQTLQNCRDVITKSGTGIKLMLGPVVPKNI